jgi:hypothetical protein
MKDLNDMISLHALNGFVTLHSASLKCIHDKPNNAQTKCDACIALIIRAAAFAPVTRVEHTVTGKNNPDGTYSNASTTTTTQAPGSDARHDFEAGTQPKVDRTDEELRRHHAEFVASGRPAETSGVNDGKSDDVFHPDHYTNHPSGVECWDVAQHFNFNLGNVFKYVWRAGKKDATLEGTLQDLEKGDQYLQHEIERVSGLINRRYVK